MSLSVELRIDGRRCVVVGAGRIGARRARQLLDAGAAVTVVAPAVGEGVRSLSDGGHLSLAERPFDVADADGAFLVVAATDSPEVNEVVHAAAAAAGALVNRADDATSGDLLVPAVVGHGPLRVTVSTDGRAPAVTRWAADRLRGSLDEALGLTADQVTDLVEIVAEVRAELAAEAGGEAGGGFAGGGRSVDWRSALDRTMLEEICRGHRAVAKERLKACLLSS